MAPEEPTHPQSPIPQSSPPAQHLTCRVVSGQVWLQKENTYSDSHLEKRLAIVSHPHLEQARQGEGPASVAPGLQGCLRGQTINSLGCPPIWAPYSPIGRPDFGLTAVLIECSAVFEVTLSMKSELELSLFFLGKNKKRFEVGSLTGCSCPQLSSC